MSKVECTAVNELIDLVQQKPLGAHLDDGEIDPLFGPPRQVRLRGTEPPPALDLFAVELPPVPQKLVKASPAAPAVHSAPMHAQPLRYVDAADASAAPPLHLDTLPVHRATSNMDRFVPLGALARRFALPVAALVGLGIATGLVYTLASGHGDAGPSVADVTFTAANAVPPLPKLIATPPVAAPPAAPKLVQVRLESTPPGASATLLSNGVSTPLGSTPVDASVDPTKHYDVVFAYPDQPSKVEHFDASAVTHVTVAFDPAPAAAIAAAATQKPGTKSAAKSARHHHAASVARVAVAPPSRHTKSPAAAAAASAGGPVPDPGEGNGTLAVVTDAPCAILIDDHNTGLTSPQRAIPVPAGHHNVRLIAAALHVNKLVPVDITAHRVSRIDQKLAK